jgi:hypothetical protein
MRFPYWFTGAGGARFMDSRYGLSPNGDIVKFPSQKYNRHESWDDHKNSGSPSFRQTPPSSLRFPDIGGSVRSNLMQTFRCHRCLQEVTRGHQCYSDSIKEPINANHQMTYHNMFTPSQEPGTLWQCRRCGKEVTNRWHHFHSHTAQRSMCPFCPATYSRIDTLRSHLKQKHKNHAPPTHVNNNV